MDLRIIGVPIEILAIIISAISLLIALSKEVLLPIVFKPRLELFTMNAEPFVRFATSKIGRSRWARVRLKNKGGFFTVKARNCYLKLLEIRDSQNVSLQPFDPAPLKWTVYQNLKNDLSKGELHFIDLVQETEHVRALIPTTENIPTLLMQQLESKLGPGEYFFRVGVFGDNFNSFEKTIKVKLGKTFGELSSEMK